MLSIRIQEVIALSEGQDLSLATRRLMDLCDEFPTFHDLRGAAMELRADYNMGRELGAAEMSGASGSALSERCRQLAGAIGRRSVVATGVDRAPTEEAVFLAQQMTKAFRSGGHHFQLGPIDLELRTGRIVGVVGENGNGKTTLLRQIAGLLDHDAGRLLHPHAGTDPYRIRQTIAWIPQRSVRWQGTLLQNLRFQAAVHGTIGAANEDRVLYTLHRLGLTRFKDLTWKQLSSGYKLRFELAKMLVWRPKLLVLDEPIANLDLQAQQLFLQDLKHLAASQSDPVAVILSSQQLHEIEAVADDIIFLKNGKAVYSGAAHSFDSDRSSNVFELRGVFQRAQLEQALGATAFLHIDDTGLIFRLTTPRTVGPQEVLKAIANADLVLSYFRDISTSTRKLFHQDP